MIVPIDTYSSLLCKVYQSLELQYCVGKVKNGKNMIADRS